MKAVEEKESELGVGALLVKEEVKEVLNAKEGEIGVNEYEEEKEKKGVGG